MNSDAGIVIETGRFGLPPPSTEFRLAAVCAGWPYSVTPVRDRISPEIDWERFLTLVKRHRIAGLVYRSLTYPTEHKGVPENVLDALSADARRVAFHNLRLTAEALKLDHLMEAAGIEAAFLKGATLATLAYGDIGVRHSKDIDLLVAPQKLEAAISVLTDAGYEIRYLSNFSQSQLAQLKRYNHHISLFHPAKGCEVELHWRAVKNSFLMPEMPLPPNWVAIALGGAGTLRTLSSHDLLLYLCAHGAGHCWFRMKWLVDIAALVTRMDESELWVLVQRAKFLGILRPLSQGLLLASSVLEVPIPASIANLLLKDWAMRPLVAIASSALRTVSEPYDMRFGTAPMSLSQYLLRTDWHYWSEQLAVHFWNQEDWQEASLPASLGFLYPLVRLFLWSRRQLNASFRSSAAHG